MLKKIRPRLSLVALGLGLAGASQAAPIDSRGFARLDPYLITPVVVFEHDGRLTIEDFAKEQKQNVVALRRSHAASGLMRCGRAHGAGQLTLSDDVVTTAAHVFFDATGALRSDHCDFILGDGGDTLDLPVDLSSIVAGSKNPYAENPVHDWAVAKLIHPAIGITPYTIADAFSPNMPVEFAARGHRDWGEHHLESLELCHLHDELSKGAEGTREFSFDCDTGDGASGGAVLVDSDHPQIGAILVGWRSNTPDRPEPFSAVHYNFVVTLEGAFKNAVFSMARETTAAP